MTHQPRKKGIADRWEAALRDHGLGFPEVTEDFPWGHCALKVKGKAFVFMSREGDSFGLSVKLPQSQHVALMLPFTEPTGYGLGRSGWVSANFGPKDDPPLAVLKSWLEESYRAVAPKRLAARLGAEPAPAATAPKRKSAAAKKKR